MSVVSYLSKIYYVGNFPLRIWGGFPDRPENLKIMENENGHEKVTEHEKLAKKS